MLHAKVMTVDGLVANIGSANFNARSAARDEEVNLVAPLSREKIALTQRWWFWTGVAVLVAGAASVTYLVVRKDQTPERPAVDGGGLGWTLPLR